MTSHLRKTAPAVQLILRQGNIVIRSAALAFVLAATAGLTAAQTGQRVLRCDRCDAPSATLRSVSQIAGAGSQTPDPPARSDSLPAASQNSGLSPEGWLRRFADDQWRIYSGPFRSESAVKWDLLVAGTTGGLIAADRHITNQLPRDNLYVSREISNVGTYGTIGTVGALWLTGVATDNAHAREAGVLGIESIANGAALWAVANTLTRRERPLEGTGRGRFWVNNGLKSSMPSAHVLFTWAAASTIAHEYPNPAIQALAYGTATAVSVTRVTGLRHFPADSFVGGIFGYLIAREMFRLHCEPGVSPGCHKTRGGNQDLLPDEQTSTARGTASKPRRIIASVLDRL